MSRQYRKKPVVIEAVQWTGTRQSLRELEEFMDDDLLLKKSEDQYNIIIPTLEGLMTANVGDYIIKGVQGEFYPCKEDIFKDTYEHVNEEPN